jgi:hypothetical protein
MVASGKSSPHQAQAAAIIENRLLEEGAVRHSRFFSERGRDLFSLSSFQMRRATWRASTDLGSVMVRVTP